VVIGLVIGEEFVIVVGVRRSVSDLLHGSRGLFEKYRGVHFVLMSEEVKHFVEN